MWYPGNSQIFKHFLSNKVPASMAGALLHFANPEAALHPGIAAGARFDSVMTPDVYFRAPVQVIPVLEPIYTNVVVDLYATQRGQS